MAKTVITEVPTARAGLYWPTARATDTGLGVLASGGFRTFESMAV